MSLTVHTIIFGKDRDWTSLDAPGPGADLAGFESFRTTVWGSNAMRALGARYFPVLCDGSTLMVLPEEVTDFLNECTMVAANLEKIVPNADAQHSHEWYVETISGRLANIRAAAERALEVGGGVLVW